MLLLLTASVARADGDLEPGVFAPHFRLGEIADGAEALGRPVPYGLARPAYAAVSALSRPS